MEKIEKLKVIRDKISQNLLRSESENKHLEQDDCMLDSMSVDAIKKIDERERKKIGQIRKSAQELRDNIEKKNRKYKQMISQRAQEIDKTKNTLKVQQEKIQSAIKSTKAEIIFAAAAEYGGKILDLSFTKLRPEIQEFVSGKHDISKLCGILTTVKSPNKSHPTEFKVLKRYTTDLHDVHRLVSLDLKTAWISSYTGNILRKVLIDDQIITIKEIPLEIFDMALTKRNDILLSICDSSEVKLLTNAEEIKSFISVAPLQPTGIHLTNNNDIILGVMDKGDIYKLTDTSCRKIIVFGENNKVKQSYQYKKHKQRLFTYPFRITDVNFDIVVIDRTSEDDGRVVVLGKEGDVKWIFQGHPQINTEDKPFDPKDIVTTSVGNVIVADSNNHTLHVISGGGELLKYKVMSDQGVKLPLSLDIYTWGHLSVGCNTYEGETLDAKVHIVKL
jgi:hypothetical protein